MLEKFQNYMENVAEEHPYSILKEIQKDNMTKQRSRPSVSAELIRDTLLLHYTSKTTRQITSGKVTMTIFFFIRENLKRWRRVNYSCKTAPGKKDHLSQDSVLIGDEIYDKDNILDAKLRKASKLTAS